MKTASIKEIKSALETTPAKELMDYCLRMVKFKKENKELLTYLLFDSADEAGYVKSVKDLLDEIFETVNTRNVYFAKKTLRKIIRTANRYLKYSAVHASEADILIHICEKMLALDINFKKHAVLNNLYLAQLKKIKKSVEAMHEDEQYDYLKAISRIS